MLAAEISPIVTELLTTNTTINTLADDEGMQPDELRQHIYLFISHHAPGFELATVAQLRKHRNEILFHTTGEGALAEAKGADAEFKLHPGQTSKELVCAVLVDGLSMTDAARTLRMHRNHAYLVFIRTIYACTGLSVSGVKDARRHREEILSKMGVKDEHWIMVRVRARHARKVQAFIDKLI